MKMRRIVFKIISLVIVGVVAVVGFHFTDPASVWRGLCWMWLGAAAQIQLDRFTEWLDRDRRSSAPPR